MEYAAMLLLITGPTGKVGANLINRILSDPQYGAVRIRALCHNRSVPETERVEIVRGSIADREAVEAAIAGVTQCAPKARNTSGGRFHPGSCRLIW
jgi:UDP-glucose 4-epimerase